MKLRNLLGLTLVTTFCSSRDLPELNIPEDVREEQYQTDCYQDSTYSTKYLISKSNEVLDLLATYKIQYKIENNRSLLEKLNECELYLLDFLVNQELKQNYPNYKFYGISERYYVVRNLIIDLRVTKLATNNKSTLTN